MGRHQKSDEVVEPSSSMHLVDPTKRKKSENVLRERMYYRKDYVKSNYFLRLLVLRKNIDEDIQLVDFIRAL